MTAGPNTTMYSGNVTATPNDDHAMHTIAHFKRLPLNSRRDVAPQFDLIVEEDGTRDEANQWLLRARDKKIMADLARACQLAPQ